jgi:hypothetical protein
MRVIDAIRPARAPQYRGIAFKRSNHMTAQRTYPTVPYHNQVKCPKCGNFILTEGRQYGQLADAQWAKHCGAPCYGTAWYNFKPEPSHHWAG